MSSQSEMQLILQPTAWTCNPSAFAMCMDITLDQMLQTLGHDGSRIVNFKATRVIDTIECFDNRELLLAAYKHGYAAVEFPVKLKSVIPDVLLNPHWPSVDDFWNMFPTWQRFVIVMQSDSCEHAYHCVAWQRDKPYYFDPLCGRVDGHFRNPVKHAIAILRINCEHCATIPAIQSD